MDSLNVALIVFVSVFIQTASGFGLGVIGMPLLVSVISLDIARPLMVAVSMLSRIFMLGYYRQSLSFNPSLWRVMGAMVIGIPMGFFLLRQIDKHTVEVLLGILVALYALYSLIAPKIPELKGRKWAVGLGAISGMLSGAYNSGGPALVIYATGRRWQPLEFKSNLQMLALVNGITAFIVHLAEGNFTSTVVDHWLLAIPAIMLGSVMGFVTDRFINPVIFRKIVLVMLLVIGVNLII